MRLIDADALLKALNDYGLSYRADINGMIMQAPTIAPSGDLISRADVFEIIDKAFSQPMGNVVTLYADICLMLNVLPTHANSRSTHERDLISRADAIEAVKETILKRFNLADWYEEMLNCGVEIEDRINALPSADAVSIETQVESTRKVLDDFAKDRVKVVRCKDCRWFKQDSSPVGYGYCDGRMVGREVDYNDYCSYGEREVNGFKSVGQAWNTSQERWEK